jgi:hypothetical protein
LPEPTVTRTRGAFGGVPGQYDIPRRTDAPWVNAYFQTSLPVSASSATTLDPAAKYMTLLMTIGDDPPGSYAQACASFDTLAGVI